MSYLLENVLLINIINSILKVSWSTKEDNICIRM